MKPGKTWNLLYFSEVKKKHANTEALEIYCKTEVQYYEKLI